MPDDFWRYVFLYINIFHTPLKDFFLMLAKSYIVNIFTIMREGG